MRVFIPIIFFLYFLFQSYFVKANFLSEKKILIDSIGKVKIYRNSDTTLFYFQAGMAIDADGSPRAYCEADTGIDHLKNAGRPGNWWGIACDQDGNPYKQNGTDPYPGYYVSTTSLVNRNYHDSEPHRYANADSIPYIALPIKFMKNNGIFLGDLAMVIYGSDTVFALVADAGPEGKIGEGSMALAGLLGIKNSPKKGGVSSGVSYFIFPESGMGNGTIPDAKTIQNAGKKWWNKINSL